MVEVISDVLESFLNKFVKVLFNDGENVRSIKGNLVSYSFDFVKIKTLSDKDFLINRSQIFKIERSNSNGSGDWIG